MTGIRARHRTENAALNPVFILDSERSEKVLCWIDPIALIGVEKV